MVSVQYQSHLTHSQALPFKCLLCSQSEEALYRHILIFKQIFHELENNALSTTRNPTVLKREVVLT